MQSLPKFSGRETEWKQEREEWEGYTSNSYGEKTYKTEKLLSFGLSSNGGIQQSQK